jgi:hypothetical protein
MRIYSMRGSPPSRWWGNVRTELRWRGFNLTNREDLILIFKEYVVYTND